MRRFTLDVDEDVMDSLKVLAAKYDVSLGAMIRHVVNDWMDLVGIPELEKLASTNAKLLLKPREVNDNGSPKLTSKCGERKREETNRKPHPEGGNTSVS